MKLKFLLMPTTIIISIILVIWYIWPRIFNENADNSVVTLKKEIKREKDELDKVNLQKNIITKLNGQLASNEDIDKLVAEYYPEKIKEEEIINKVNQAAFASGVFVFDMDISLDGKNKKSSFGQSDDLGKVLKISEIAKNKVKTPAKTALTKDTTPKTKKIGRNKEKTNKWSAGLISAKLDVFGNYDQIKSFLASLYSLGMLNNVQSFNIAIPDDTKQSATSSENANEEGEAGGHSKTLEAVTVINFAYQKRNPETLTDMLENSLFTVGGFRIAEIKQKEDLMKEKYPKIEIGSTGESNPFFPKQSN